MSSSLVSAVVYVQKVKIKTLSHGFSTCNLSLGLLLQNSYPSSANSKTDHHEFSFSWDVVQKVPLIHVLVFLTTRLISPHLGTVCSPDPTPEIWIQNESRQVPGTCFHKQASSGACSSDRIQRGGSPQPHLPLPECPVFPLKPHFHHLLGGQLLSPGHCSSGRCALSWNHPVRSPERTFPIPKKLASS